MMCAVAAVWIAMTAQAIAFVAAFASPVPFNDDHTFVLPFVPGTPLDAEELWSPFNEHRLPLVRLVIHGLLLATRDIRAPMYFQVALLSLLSLAMILFVRRLRGRTNLEDVLFPLLWLHRGNAENLLMGLQIVVGLPTALVGVILMVVAARPRSIQASGAGALAILGACALALPLCGGFGTCQAAPIALWMCAGGIRGWRNSNAQSERRRSLAMLVLGVLVIVVVGLSLRDLPVTKNMLVEHDPGKAIVIASQFLGQIFGPVAASQPVAFVSAAIALAILALALCVQAMRVRPLEGARASESARADESARAGALACLLAATLALAASIGWARQADWPVAGWANRYVTAPSPLVASAFVAALLYAPPMLARIVNGGLALAFLGVLPFDQRIGTEHGRAHARISASFLEAVQEGASFDELAHRYWREMFISAVGFKDCLRRLQVARFAPFTDAEVGRFDRFDLDPLAVLKTRPMSASSPVPMVHRRIQGVDVLALHAPAELVFALEPTASAITGRCGVLPVAYLPLDGESPPMRGLRIEIELDGSDGARRKLWSRDLDPARVIADRGLQPFAIDLSAGVAGELVLRVTSLSAEHAELDWGALTEVELR